MSDQKPFAEIIESSLHNWLAQSWQWNNFPASGSLVTIQAKKYLLFGIVYQVQTGSMDPIRYPFPYKKTEEELLQEQPQIFEFLKTTFSCLSVGYSVFAEATSDKKDENKIYYQLPPQPAQIHAFVQPTSRQQYQEFFKDTDYLHLIFSFSSILGNIDELLLAILKQLTENKVMTENIFEQFINTFCLLNGNDYCRLRLFLQRTNNLF